MTVPLLPTVQHNLFNHYKGSIPPCFHPYIGHIKDVKGDGNCSFRAIAVGLGLHEMEWPHIRQELLGECNRHLAFWNTIDDVETRLVRNTLPWKGIQFAPANKWLLMPFTGLMIASRWNVICQVLSPQGCATIFPMFTTAEDSLPHQTVTLVHVNNNHFIHLKLEGDYPMPTPSGCWRQPARNTFAMSWENMYIDRIARYNEIVSAYKTTEFQDLT